MTFPAILPCPFCGGPASLEKDDTSGVGARFTVGCDNKSEVDCMGYQSLTTFARRVEAIDAWNRRANDKQRERDELYHYVYGLIGFLQLIKDRDDVSQELRDIMRTNHRVADAAAYLTQIVPPNGK